MENEVKEIMKKLERKSVKIIISGIVESKFYMNKLNYVIEDGILLIQDSDFSYIDIDIENIEKLYLEFTNDGYVLLVFEIEKKLHIELQAWN